ncbi:MAG: hypothetical protein E7403_02875 [Ruminococcaceae bacterium]|nr:hypothetical protein [Oscillospiraceae bacterium]
MIHKHDNLSFEVSAFQKPAAQFSPIFSWVFNSEMTEELVRKQIDEMCSVGIRGTYILPEPPEFRPDTMATEMSPAYLSEDFFKLIRYAVRYAKEKGMVMWLYDEGGWPSGAACGQVLKALPDKKAKRLRKKEITLQAGETFAGDELTISIFNENYERLPLPFSAGKEQTIFVYEVEVRDVYEPYLLDEEAVAKFIELTHEGYKKHMGDLFGNGVYAMFTDEPILYYPFYLADTTDFEETCGYCFKEMVPALIGPNVLGEKGKQFKIDYIEYCAELFTKNYFETIQNWCRENNLLATGHLDGDHVIANFHEHGGTILRNLRTMDIPGVDVIWRQVWPGKEDMNFFPRFASSAAHQTGGKYAVSESFGVYGSGLTFDETRYVCGYQLVRGINIFNIQSIPSGRVRFLAAGEKYVPESPLWDYMPALTGYLSRMEYIASVGQVCAEVALYMPNRDAWVGNTESEQSFYAIGKEMEEHQLYFDTVDDFYIMESTVSNGSMGQAGYKVIVLPETKYIKKETLAQLEQFIEAGGKVYAKEPGLVKGALPYSGDVPATYSLLHCNNPHIRVMKRVTEEESLYFLYNESKETETFVVSFDEEYPYTYRLDALTGKIYAYETNKAETLVSGGDYIILFSHKQYEVVGKPEKGECLGTVNLTSCQKLCQTTLTDGAWIKTKAEGEMKEWEPTFSGTAVYSGTFMAKAQQSVILDLGKVCYYSEVSVNGQVIGQSVMSPYEVFVDGSIIKEENEISIKVTNTGANAMYHLPEGTLPERMFANYVDRTSLFEKDSLPSGLLSAVNVYTIK